MANEEDGLPIGSVHLLHQPCELAVVLLLLAGLQPPVIGGGAHSLIPHVAIVDQVLHQCVQVPCQLAAVQVLHRVGLAKAGDADLDTRGVGHKPRAPVVDNPGVIDPAVYPEG